MQGQSTTHAASVAQAAALAAIEGPTDELEKMRVEFDKRRKAMVARLREIPGVKCVEPKGAFYAFPDLSAFIGKKTPEGKKIENDVQLCEWLIEAAQGRGRPGLGLRRARLRAPVVRDLDEERRGGRAAHGRGAAEADVADLRLSLGESPHPYPLPATHTGGARANSCGDPPVAIDPSARHLIYVGAVLRRRRTSYPASLCR